MPKLKFVRPAWMDSGRCAEVDPDLFFADFKGDKHAHVAKRICATCEVRDTCLEYALNIIAVDDFGVWGGTTEAERKAIRAERGITTIDLTDSFDLRDFVVEEKATPVLLAESTDFLVDEEAEEAELEAQITRELAAA